ncbi:CYTH domain-containing protein, partial [bacterium]|nr:CYTH domain-containing protein [bacterium]
LLDGRHGDRRARDGDDQRDERQNVTNLHDVRLLEALGFRQVREVAKRRRPARVTWEGAEIEIALDAVAGLGDFVELELLADREGIPQATARLESLAVSLGCTTPERRSYLELLRGDDRPAP